MKREEHNWSNFEITKEPTTLSPEYERDYSVPFNWGNLVVTKGAKDAYGIVPLTADLSSDDIPSSSATGLHTDIYILSPEEYLALSSEMKPSYEFFDNNSASFATIYPNGMDVYLGYRNTKTEIATLLTEEMDNLAQKYGYGGCVDDVVNEDNIPFTEIINNGLPQRIIHDLANTTDGIVSMAAREFIVASYGKLTLKQVTNLGAISLFSAGMSMQSSLALDGTARSAITGSFIGLSVGSAYGTYKALKKHIAGENVRARDNLLLAADYGKKVGDDIHDIFCAKHFNDQTERLINGHDS